MLISLALVVALLTALLMLPFSDAGSRRIVAWIDSATPLDIEYTSGSLFGLLELKRLSLPAGAVRVEASGLKIQLDASCLWHSEFCFDLQLLEGAVNWPGGRWQQGAMSASGIASAESITLRSVDLVEGDLIFDPAEDSEPAGFIPPEVLLPLLLQVDSMRVATLDVLVGDVSQQLESIALVGRWSGTELSLAQLELGVPGVGHLQTQGSAQLQGLWSLALDAEVSLEGDLLPPAVQQREAQLLIVGALDDLHLNVRSEGAPDADLDARLNVTEVGVPYSSDWSLEWASVMPLVELVPSLTETDFALEGPLSGSAQGELLGEQTAEFSAQFSGEGYTAIDAAGTLNWQAPMLTVSDLTLRDAISDSALHLNATAQLAQSWSVEGRIASDGFTLPEAAGDGRLAGAVSLAAQGEGASWSVELGSIALEGEVAGLPAIVKGRGGIDSNLELLPGALHASVNGTDLSLAVDADRASMSLVLDSLSRWLPRSRGRIELTGEGSTALHSLQLEGSGRGIELAEVQVPLANIRGQIDRASSRFRLAVDAPEIIRFEREFGVQIDAEGDLESFRANIQSRGELAGELRLSATAQDGAWQGELAPAQLETSAGSWASREPVAVSWLPIENQWLVAPHCWKHSEFELCGSKLQFGAQGDVQLTMAGDTRALEATLPRGMRLRGEAQGRLNAQWRPDAAPELDAQLKMENLRVVRRYGMGERVRTEYELIQLGLARQDDGRLGVTGQVRQQGREVASVAGMLPQDSNGAMDLELTIDTLPLTSFTPWFPEISSLEGQVSGRIDASGPVLDPDINGTLSLAEGRLALVGNPTELTDLEMQLTVREGGGDIAGRGMLGGGELRFEGPLQVQPELTLELSLSGERHEVLMPPASELVVSEELAIAFSDRKMQVTGEIKIHEGVLRHEELPAGSVAISDDVVIVDLAGNAIETERPIALDADVWIRIRDRFRVEGEQVQAVLGGDLHLVQTPTTPLQVYGTLNLLGGELRAYQQTLQIKRGTIAFSGPADNPELDVAAEREIRSDDVTVGARLSGSLDDAQLEVYSDPVMSQSEAMSYLVRGRGLDAGAGADGTALALAMGADVVNRSGIVSELNRMPLISDVAFGTSGSEDDTAATVSGYIGNRIYVSYGVGIYEPINVFTARLYLQSRLWLEVVSRLESSVDLYYSFEID
ncbi:translocation/assembly module TamB domain-containing protein [Halioglobus maricola]|uniref:translocation/assembly module TamB domain-containing protein n=1 Tax=Halioglobus maricola TaxID=2601894 RepID=UPI00128C115E|nr:translocation/assembly module TamB domain-containing protein [Halioglobus maricola]